MRQALAILWKTYRELRWFVIVALLLILLPVFLEALLFYRKFGRLQSDFAPSLMGGLGAIFAILIAINVTCRDLKEPLFTFWNSKPFGYRKYLFIHYLSGLTVLLIICIVPLLIQFLCFLPINLMQNPLGIIDDWCTNILWAGLFTFTLIYSGSFLIGCLIRSSVSTALLSLAVALFIYFAPLLIPGLKMFETFHWFDDGPVKMRPVAWVGMYLKDYMSFALGNYRFYIAHQYLMFALGMLLLSAWAFLLSLWVVKRDYRWEMNQKTTCWSMAAVFILLLWGSSQQLGVNMKLERRVQLPDQIVIKHMNLSQGKGVVLGRKMNRLGVSAFDASKPNPIASESFAMDDFEFMGKGRDDSVRISRYVIPPLAWNQSQPDFAYTFTQELVVGRKEPNGVVRYKRDSLELVAVHTKQDNPHRPAKIVHRLNLKDYMDIEEDFGGTYYMMKYSPSFPKLHCEGNELMIFTASRSGTALLVFDITEPDEPVFQSCLENPSVGLFLHAETDSPNDPYYIANIYKIPGLSLQESLNTIVALGHSGDNYVFDGNLLVCKKREENEYRFYEFLGFDDFSEGRYSFDDPNYHRANFKLIKTHKISPLISLLGNNSRSKMLLHEGMLYDLTHCINDCVMVYDIRSLERISRVGHYAAGSERFYDIAPLPGGRVLLAGNELHYLLPPGTN